MADHHDVTTRTAADDIAEDDPLAELARIIGYERPQSPRQQVTAPETAPEIDVFDLEAELLRELEVPAVPEAEAPLAVSPEPAVSPEIVDIPDVLAAERPDPFDSVDLESENFVAEFEAELEAHSPEFAPEADPGEDILGESALFEALENELAADTAVEPVGSFETDLLDEEFGDEELERQEEEWVAEDDVSTQPEAVFDEPAEEPAETAEEAYDSYASDTYVADMNADGVDALSDDDDLATDEAFEPVGTHATASETVRDEDSEGGEDLESEPALTAGDWPEESDTDIFESLLEWPDETAEPAAEPVSAAPASYPVLPVADLPHEAGEARAEGAGSHDDDVLADIERFDIPDIHAAWAADTEQTFTPPAVESLIAEPDAEFAGSVLEAEAESETGAELETAAEAEPEIEAEFELAEEAETDAAHVAPEPVLATDFADELSAELDIYQQEIGLSESGSAAAEPIAETDEPFDPFTPQPDEPVAEETRASETDLDAELGTMLDRVFSEDGEAVAFDNEDEDADAASGPSADDDFAASGQSGMLDDVSPVTEANLAEWPEEFDMTAEDIAALEDVEWDGDDPEGDPETLEDSETSSPAPDDGALSAFELETRDSPPVAETDGPAITDEEIPDTGFDAMSDWLDELAGTEPAAAAIAEPDAAPAGEPGESEEHSVVPFPGPAARSQSGRAGSFDMGAEAFDPQAIQDAGAGPRLLGDLDVPSIPDDAVGAEDMAVPSYESDLEREFATLVEDEGRDLYAAASTSWPADAANEAGEVDFGDLESGFGEGVDTRDAGEMTYRPRPVPVDADAPVDAEDQNGGGDDNRRGPLIAIAVLGVAVFFGVAGLGWSWISGGGTADGEPRIIRADTEPVKVVPENPGGLKVPNQDKAVYDRVAGNDTDGAAQPRLVDSSEEPVDVVQRTIDPDFLPLEGRSAEPGAGKDEDRLTATNTQSQEDAPQAATPLLEPRRVQTMVVLPDGTIVPREEPTPEPVVEMAENSATPLAPTSPDASAQDDAAGQTGNEEPASQAAATGETAGTDGASADGANGGVVAPVQTVETTTFRPEDAPVPVSRPAEQPVNVVGTVTETGRVAGETEVASAEPQSQPVANPGGYYVQIASQPTSEGAEASYRTLSGRYESIIGGRGVDYQRADIPGKGVYHRVRIPAGERADATALCARYKEAGGSCFVTR